MFVTATAVLDRFALRTSAHRVELTARGCELHVPFTGALSSSMHTKLTCAVRRNMIEMRYGMRLKGVTVTTDGDVLTVSAVASRFAVDHWVGSGEFVGAVEAAVRAVTR